MRLAALGVLFVALTAVTLTAVISMSGCSDDVCGKMIPCSKSCPCR